jgi:hypothetical protein
VSVTASWWACSMIAATARGAIGQRRVDTLLTGGEGQIVPGHGGGGLPRDSGQMTGQFAGIVRVPGRRFLEHPGRDVGAWTSAGTGASASSSRSRLYWPERAGRAAVKHVGLLVTRYGLPSRLAASSSKGSCPQLWLLLDCVGIRVPALVEQRFRLRLGDVPGYGKSVRLERPVPNQMPEPRPSR